MAGLIPLEVFLMLGIGVFVIALRTVARIKAVGVSAFQLDDYLMLAAAIIYALETGCAYIVMDWWMDLANSGMTPEQRKNLDPDSEEYYRRVGGSKTQLVEWSLYVLLLWTLKMCMCLFYHRLTAGLYEFEIRVKLGYVLLIVTWLATQLCILLGCQPFQNSWQIYPEPHNFCQPAISKLNLYTTIVLNISTDIYLMSIPIPMLWKANLITWRKLSLLIIFCGGVFVMMCGVMRCIIVLQNPVTGAERAGTWACRETFLAVITSNCPVIYPLFRRGVERLSSAGGLLSHIPSFFSSTPPGTSAKESGTSNHWSRFSFSFNKSVAATESRTSPTAGAGGRASQLRAVSSVSPLSPLPPPPPPPIGAHPGIMEEVLVLEDWEEEHERAAPWGRGSRDYIMRAPVLPGDWKDIESGGRVISYGGSKAPPGFI